MVDLTKFQLKDIKAELENRSKKYSCENAPYRSIIIFGPPGSGKGTQAEILENKFCYCKLSSGDIFRSHIKNGTALGLEAKAIMDRGELISDELTYKMIDFEKIVLSEECKKGVIFDGFPRLPSHANYLSALLEKIHKPLTHVFVYKYDSEKLQSRIVGRLIHVQSGRVYHEIHKPPKIPGKDDLTGEELIKREDDKNIAKRISIYEKDTMPILKFYEKIAYNIDSDFSINTITFNLLDNLKLI